MHFETIWNEAESVAKDYSELDRKKILKQCREYLDSIADSETDFDYHDSIGNLLFHLCSMCAYLDEKKSIVVNSATALSDAISKNRQKLLDNENEKK